MNISIHRGAAQIGGCITEISSGSCRILIDLGCNLPGTEGSDFSAAQICQLTANADAVFYTHNHSDHVGFFDVVDEKIPQYIGEGAKEVMACKYDKLGDEVKIAAVNRMRTYRTAEKIDVAKKGMIFVTPYFVSHSAFDAYMFKIECEGKTILHTGDFRRHGYLGKGLIPMLEKYVGQVDILITEGTMLGREEETVIEESAVKENIEEFLKTHKYVYVLTSSTDMERLASLHAACRETGRVFLADEYQRQILDVFSHHAGGECSLFNFDRVFELINFRAHKVRKKLSGEGFLMPVRTSGKKLVKAMLKTYSDEPSWLVYSMWSGYAEKDSESCIDGVVEIRELFGDRIKDGSRDGVHTSGHADVGTLKQVCGVVRPRIGIIPVHKEKDADFGSILEDKTFRVFHPGEYTVDNLNITVK